MSDRIYDNEYAGKESLPFISTLLLRLRFRGPRAEALLGDLIEEYEQWTARSADSRKVKAWFSKHLLLSLFSRLPRRRIPLVTELPEAASGGSIENNDYRGGPAVFLDHIHNDFRIAIRTLIRKPLFATLVITTLALGIGANTLIFSIFHSTMLRPLPYSNPEQLVTIFRVEERITGLNPSVSRLSGLYAVPFALYQDWKQMGPVFQEMGTYSTTAQTVTGGDYPERIIGLQADSGVFSALEADAHIGRVFAAEDDSIGAPNLVVLSHSLWQQRYGSDPDIIGSDLILSGTPCTVIGVMPVGFYYPNERIQFWMTFVDNQKSSDYRTGGYLQVIARLKDGLTLEAAQAEMDGVAVRLGEEHPEEIEHGVKIVSRIDQVISQSRMVVFFFMGAVGFILLIMCANIAGLLLVRTMERNKEIAVRSALGSSKGRLVMQTLAESISLSIIGGFLGTLIAILGLRPFVNAIPGGIARSSEVAVDYRLLLIALLVTIITGLLIGVIPAFRSARTSLTEAMGRDSRSATGGRKQARSQAVLVVAQIMIAFFLLAGAGLMIRSYLNITNVDLGFDPTNMLTTQIRLPGSITGDAEKIQAIYNEIEFGIRAIPGVENVGFINQSPFISGLSFPPMLVETTEGQVEAGPHMAISNSAYLETMGISLLTGRIFNNADGPEGAPVVLVNQAMVNRYWPDEEPLGRRIKAPFLSDGEWLTVVGVIGDVQYYMGGDAFPEFYIPLSQNPSSGLNLHIRTSIDPVQLTGRVREVIWNVNPDIPLTIRQMEDRVYSDSGVQGPLFGARAISILALLAGILALIGIYGTLAFSVARQVREIGIRIALGASKENVVKNILGRGLFLTATGLLLGLGISLAGAGVLRAALYGISPSDPVTLIQVSVLMLIAAGAAALLPAYRATRINPVEALRQE